MKILTEAIKDTIQDISLFFKKFRECKSKKFKPIYLTLMMQNIMFLLMGIIIVGLSLFYTFLAFIIDMEGIFIWVFTLPMLGFGIFFKAKFYPKYRAQILKKIESET